jgi:hypothetical protein
MLMIMSVSTFKIAVILHSISLRSVLLVEETITTQIMSYSSIILLIIFPEIIKTFSIKGFIVICKHGVQM